MTPTDCPLYGSCKGDALIACATCKFSGTCYAEMAKETARFNAACAHVPFHEEMGYDRRISSKFEKES